MTFTHAVSSGLQNYVNFRARAARSEYWYWLLFIALTSIAAGLTDLALFPRREVHLLNTLVCLALVLPGLAVSVRRLHDLDRTGWWMLLIFGPTIGVWVLIGLNSIVGWWDFLPIIPIIGGVGWIVLLIWKCTPGTAGPNRFGPDPLGLNEAYAA